MARLMPIALLMGAAIAAPAFAQSDAQTHVWDYISYKRDPYTGQFKIDKNNAGTLELIEKDGKAMFRIVAGRLDVCYRGDIPATVERTAETTTITRTETVPGCPLFRYVIRNDGSGGIKQVMNDGQWRSERVDHGLTPHH